ncbi:MAG: putative flap endonuclease-1-like 5' DNA nuclease [Candidatus Azotimanducaceae bacterium]|jgi:predicted flap endonuclease-1-like 5' DNA nuclease
MQTPPALVTASEEKSSATEALRAEVNKWQERVPKLASALRLRTEELAAARDQIRGFQQQPSGAAQEVDTRLKTRDGLIKELEEKLAKLTEKHQKLSGEMHGVELGRQAAHEDLAGWKDKWQQVSESLDGEASQRAALQEQLNTLREKQTQNGQEHESALSELTKRNTDEATNLARRNEQLIESMELANKQIATLGEELSQLISRVESEKASRQNTETVLTETQAEQKISAAREDEMQILVEDMQNRIDSLSQEQLQDQAEWAERLATKEQQQVTLERKLSETESENQIAIESLQKTLETDRETVQTQSAEKQQRIEAQQQRIEAQQRQVDAQQQRIDAQEKEIASFSSEAKSQSEEIVRLEKCVQDAQASGSRFEQEKRLLLSSAQESRDEAARLKSKLEERSQLVVELEAEKQQRDDLKNDKLAELDRLKLDAETALNRVTAFQEHNNTLETRVQEQRSLIEDLERELSGEQEKSGRQKKTLDSHEKIKLDLQDELKRVQISEDDSKQLLGDELAQAEDEISTLQDEVAEAQQSVDDAKQETAQLRTELDSQRAVQNKRSEVEQQLQSELDEERCNSVEASHQVELLQTRLTESEDQLAQATVTAQTYKAELVAVRAESVDAAEVRVLGDQARVLETKLRDRTQALDEMRWRESQQEKQENSVAVVMVLNQQLKDARDEIERLKSVRVERAGDQLTLIHGVGEKLAQQLAELGLTTFAQIAELKEKDLEAESHSLHVHKTRIVRDEWIKQAKQLSQ